MTNTIQSQECSKDGGADGHRHVTDSDGDPNVFNLNRNDDSKQWLNANYANPDNQWNLEDEIVFLLRKSLYFSVGFLPAEFCFIICPFQPPSILPISSSGLDRLIYFLSSKDLVSQRICKRILRVSTFRKAICTNGIFFS